MATDPLEALREECELVSQTLLSLSEEDFEKSTRLPAWNVKELLGHMHRGVDRINTALDLPELLEADTDSVSYWRRYNPRKDAPDIAERAKSLADSFESGHALAASWDQMWRRALGRAADADRKRVVVTWGPALTLDEFLRTRVLEITAHRMDLNAALGRPPDPTDPGLEITTAVLLELLGADLPDVREWDDRALVEVGLGRRELTEAERRDLGWLAGAFPLIQ